VAQYDNSSYPSLTSVTDVVKGGSEVESQLPFTTNILIHIKDNMLKSLWNSKFGDPFHEPIDDKDFKKAVSSPVDLSTIRQKLEPCEYSSADECINDIHTMFIECRKYFKPGSPIYIWLQMAWRDCF